VKLLWIENASGHDIHYEWRVRAFPSDCMNTLWQKNCRSTKKKKEKPTTMRTDQAWRGLYPLATAADDDWNVMDCDQYRPKLPTSVFTTTTKNVCIVGCFLLPRREQHRFQQSLLHLFENWTSAVCEVTWF